LSAITLSGLSTASSARGTRLSCRVTSENLPDELWFFIKGDNGSVINIDNYNWAVVGLLFPAMLNAEDIRVDGTMSARLFQFLSGDMQSILTLYEPPLGRINISAEKLTRARREITGRAATGFSGGVDSFTTLSLFSGGDRAESITVTDLCTFNVGGLGRYGRSGVAQLFDVASDRSNSYAARKGLNGISIDSNLDAFYPASLGFQKTVTLRNIAAALTLEGYLDYYLYSSSCGLHDIDIDEHYDTSYMDPITLPMLSTENISLISAGAGLTRYEKTAIVAEHDDARKMLDVCVEPARKRVKRGIPNCSRCWKCGRTMVTLELLGALQHFDAVFDLDYYSTNRDRIHARLAVRGVGDDEDATEVLEEARRAGRPIKVRTSTYLKSYALRTATYAQKHALRFYSRLRERPTGPINKDHEVGSDDPGSATAVGR
jgi:hypothetical protein